jgi:hypothetical protein
MAARRTAHDLERAAAASRPPRAAPALGGGEALAMLVRRGLTPRLSRPDLPFPPDAAGAEAERIAERLGHYAFRLFLRGAILRGGDFGPAEASRYLSPAQARRMSEDLVELGLARPVGDGRYRLRFRARNFGGTLEWWVSRELRRRLGFDVASGVRSGAPGVGGDLDVVAAAEGKLVYLELKSSPPKHLTRAEVGAFLRRLRSLRPDLAIFAMDTALRLSDKVIPMLAGALSPGSAAAPLRLAREIWRLAPHLYAVNARQDLLENLCGAIADGLRQLGPDPP